LNHDGHVSTLERAWNRPLERTLVELLRWTASTYPEEPAVDDGHVVLTYRELMSAVAAVAGRLAAGGVLAGDRVGVRMPSGSADLYVAILGVLAAGSAYVPVDADDPDERAALVFAAAGVEYRFSFPEPEHRWMQVEATFRDVGTAPLELRMSISSPGRYSAHNFAKNVYDVRAFRADRTELAVTRTDPHGWRVTPLDGTVVVRYKVFGDRVDGTYLAIDSSHAHINMPAAVMFARGLDDRSAVLTFEPPAGRRTRPPGAAGATARAPAS